MAQVNCKFLFINNQQLPSMVSYTAQLLHILKIHVWNEIKEIITYVTIVFIICLGGGQMHKYSQIQTTIPVEAYFH